MYLSLFFVIIGKIYKIVTFWYIMKDFEKSNLSWREKKILKELDIDARKSISSVGIKLNMSKQSINYNINSMVKKGLIKEFITYIDTQKLGYTFYNVLVQLKYGTKKDKEKRVEKLKKISNVVWISSFQGKWDMVVSILAKDAGEFSMYLEQILGSLKESLLDYNFFIVISASQLGYKKIHSGADETNNYHAKVGHKDLVRLSDNDLKVLKLLANNARMSNVDIARRAKISPDGVRYCLNKLEGKKVIQGYKPLLDISKLGYLWHIMFLRLKISDEKQGEEFIGFLKNLPEVFYVVRGVGNCNLMVEFQTKTLDEFEEVKDAFTSKFGDMIVDEETVQVTDEHKCSYFPGSLG